MLSSDKAGLHTLQSSCSLQIRSSSQRAHTAVILCNPDKPSHYLQRMRSKVSSLALHKGSSCLHRYHQGS